MREGLQRELLDESWFDQEVVAKVAVSEQEIADFYNANRAQFTLAEESYRLGQIIVTPRRGTAIGQTAPATTRARRRRRRSRFG